MTSKASIFLGAIFRLLLTNRGIERLPYVNAEQRAESLTLSSSSSYFCFDVHNFLDGVQCGTAFLKAELVVGKNVLVTHVTQWSL